MPPPAISHETAEEITMNSPQHPAQMIQQFFVAILVLLCWFGLVNPSHSAIFGKNTGGVSSWFQNHSYISALNAIQQQNYGQAKQLLTKLHQQYPEQPRLLLDLAHVHHKLGETNRAHDAITQLQQQFPSSMEAQWGTQLLNTKTATATHTEAKIAETKPAMPPLTNTAHTAHTATPTKPASDSAHHTYYYPWETPAAGESPESPASTVQVSEAIASSTSSPAPQAVAPSAVNPYSSNNPTNNAAALQNMMLMSMMMGGNNTNSNNNDMGAMGSLMGGNNSGGMGGINPMMLMMMPSFMGQQGNNGAAAQQNISPEVMSNLMMQSMMSGMDFGGTSNDRH